MQVKQTDKEIIIKISAETNSAYIERILKYIHSIEKSELIHNSNIKNAFGAWEGNESAEELAKSIRDSRTINREIEEL